MAGYFLPLIIAAWRNMPNAVAISVLNVVAGWTFVGWVVALVWSCLDKPDSR
ncbi:superinfection immunity protein [Halomonas eurihalina]|uniref:superinfection immunity protein n=1 Tax=Halomonas eurihalina TaxID=42566 RepID=UPI003CCC5F8F